MFFNNKIEKAIYWFGFLLAALLVYRFVGELDFSNTDRMFGIYHLINSDTVTIYQYCSDLLNNPSMYQYWNLGTCWILFPNALLMLIWLIIPVGPTMAHFLFGTCQLLILLLLLSYLFKKLFFNNHLLLFIGNGLVLLQLIYSIHTNKFIYSANLIQPYHTGAVLSMLLELIVFFSFINQPRFYKTIIFSVITILAIVSNNIFIVYLSVPLAATLLIVWFIDKPARKTYSIFFITNIVACLAGYFLFKKLIDWHVLSVSTTNYFNLQNIIASFDTLFAQYHEIATEFSLLGFLMWLSIFGFIRALFISISLVTKKGKEKHSKTIQIFSIFIVFLTCIAFLSPALVGRYENYFCARYNIFLLWILPFTALVYIDLLLQKTKKRMLVWNTIAVALISIEVSSLFIGWDKNKPLNLPQALISYCPSEVAALDKLAKKHQLKRGIGSYWQTKLINLYSKEHLQANAVFASITLYHHANTTYGTKFVNENPNNLSRYNFIVMTEFYDSAQIHTIFKPEQLVRETIDGYSFYITPDFAFNDEYDRAKVIEKQ